MLSASITSTWPDVSSSEITVGLHEGLVRFHSVDQRNARGFEYGHVYTKMQDKARI
jgi:hypothetical protein